MKYGKPALSFEQQADQLLSRERIVCPEWRRPPVAAGSIADRNVCATLEKSGAARNTACHRTPRRLGRDVTGGGGPSS